MPNKAGNGITSGPGAAGAEADNKTQTKKGAISESRYSSSVASEVYRDHIALTPYR